MICVLLKSVHGGVEFQDQSRLIPVSAHIIYKKNSACCCRGRAQCSGLNECDLRIEITENNNRFNREWCVFKGICGPHLRALAHMCIERVNERDIAEREGICIVCWVWDERERRPTDKLTFISKLMRPRCVIWKKGLAKTKKKCSGLIRKLEIKWKIVPST